MVQSMMNPADSMSMQVHLYVSARKLKDLDVMSKSDPCAALFEFKNNNWQKIG